MMAELVAAAALSPGLQAPGTSAGVPHGLTTVAAPAEALDYSRCPVTGWDLHLDPDENAAVRVELLRKGLESERERRLQFEACRLSPLWFISHFAWTYVVKEVDPDTGKTMPTKRPHRPFIPWACQVRAINETIDAIDKGEDCLWDKSREMGASWILGAYLPAARFLFVDDSQILVTSRMADLVDKRDDPDSIFWKLDYTLNRLPAWLLPCEKSDLLPGGECRRYMIATNPRNGSTITGQATTEHIGRAGRRTFVLLDEMAAMERQAELWRSAADTTASRIANSTPLGPGTEFSRLRDQGVELGSPRVVKLTYDEHPEKGANKEWRVDTDGAITGYAGRGYWWSPWFEQERKRRDKVDIAQNILAIHEIAGLTFFDTVAVTTAMRDDAREPIARGDLELVPEELENPDLRQRVRFVPRNDGPFRVYEMPIAGACYAHGWDPSYGVGAANAGGSGFNADSGGLAWEHSDPGVGAYQLALRATLASWFWAGRHHRSGACTNFETNGPGTGWERDLFAHGCRHIYRRRAIGQLVETKSLLYGWNSTHVSKVVLLGGLNRAMQARTCRIYSRDTLGIMLTYQVTKSGQIDTPERADMTSGARAAHGDTVISAAVALLACAEADNPPVEVKEFAPGKLGRILGHGKPQERKQSPAMKRFASGGDEGIDI